MSYSYQSITLGGQDRNAESLGAFVAWLVTNNLLGAQLAQQAATEAARVKMQDLTGAAFLTTVLHGELKPEHLNEVGRGFCERYLASGDYDRDYSEVTYVGENEWHRYQEVSPCITAAFRKLTQPEPIFKKLTAKILKFPGRA
jgi:hypothetical protein